MPQALQLVFFLKFNRDKYDGSVRLYLCSTYLYIIVETNGFDRIRCNEKTNKRKTLYYGYYAYILHTHQQSIYVPRFRKKDRIRRSPYHGRVKVISGIWSIYYTYLDRHLLFIIICIIIMYNTCTRYVCVCVLISQNRTHAHGATNLFREGRRIYIPIILTNVFSPLCIMHVVANTFTLRF